MEIRQARREDISAVSEIYEMIHSCEEQGKTSVGWLRGVYPVEETASKAFEKGELFVAVECGTVVGSAVINQQQPDCYAAAGWRFRCADGQVSVMHTLAVSPEFFHRGIGEEFIRFYEKYAAGHGCCELRIDTQEKNRAARALYGKNGFEETGIALCNFNGIPGVRLVLLEKTLK